ncbi:MAG: flagellar basal-body rod protein FlgG [Gammaproteobacteria bacterium]|nr:flagellar basal-body rod protein FlgG [Gammaproteobacteria bacterium]
MERALWIGKTGLDAQQNRLAIISNNLANVNTIGFKRDRAVFEDLLYQNLRQVGGSTSQSTELPTGKRLGTGVRIVATEKLHTQGNVIQTENQLDMAINGRGYFQILLPDGSTSYSRDGSFQMNSQGQIVTSSGYELQPAITVPTDAISVSIGSDGTFSSLTQGNPTPITLGNLQLADFVNPAGLQSIGENLYLETSSSGTATAGTPGQTGLGALIQGSLESSNVNVVEELVNMIETQRAYEMNSKVISTADGMLRYVSNNL